MTQQIEIGRLLRAGTTGFIAGCRVNQLDAPSFGALVRAPLGDGYQIFGIIHDIHIDDDGLVRQLVMVSAVKEREMEALISSGLSKSAEPGWLPPLVGRKRSQPRMLVL